MSEQDFLEDASRSKQILEDLVGRAVAGYRSSGFSVTKQTPWFLRPSLVQAFGTTPPFFQRRGRMAAWTADRMGRIEYPLVLSV
jgi:hypothetical protein